MANVFCISEYGYRDTTREAVGSILRGKSLASIFVGNDGYQGALSSLAGVHMINWPDNVGCAQNVNRTVLAAQCKPSDILFVIDNDITFFPNAIDYLSNYACGNHSIVGPAIIVPDHMGLINRQVHYQKTYAKRSMVPFHSTMLSGCCLVMKYSIWAELGGYDEDYMHQYCDDDLCVRAAKIGIEITCIPKALITHEWGKTVNPEHRYHLDGLAKKDRATFDKKHPDKHWDMTGEY